MSADFGSLLPALSSAPPGPASRAMASRLRAVESRNVTHVSDAGPVFWEEARGANVRDADGNVYLDLTGAFGVALLGHRHPDVIRAVREQLERVVHGMGDVHPSSSRLLLLERLRKLSPWPDTRAVLASTGAEAVEIALKTALLATGRPGIVAFEGAYHGLTGQALSVTHRPLFRRAFEMRLYDGVAFAPFPAPGGPTPEACLERVAYHLASGAPNGDPVGAIIIEPIQGRAGVRIPPAGFMADLTRMAREHDVVLIADEVFTGMGRCGDLLASFGMGLEPDVVCLGKALGAGLPLSACIAPRTRMDSWPDTDGEAIHTSTYLGHPLSCAAALAALDVWERDAVGARVASLGDELERRLRESLADVPAVREIRGAGLFLGIELAVDGAPGAGPGVRVATEALAGGVIVLPAGPRGEVVELTPPMCLTPEQLRYGVDVVAGAVRKVMA